MRVVVAVVGVFLVGCGPRSGSLGVPTGGTTPVSDTGTPGVVPIFPAGCEELPDLAVLVDRIDVQTEEDFDFSGDGRLVYQIGPAVVGTDRAGDTVVYAASVTGDPSGIQVHPSGDIIVCGQDSSSVYRVDVNTGGVTTLASNVDRPNGLEVGDDGVIYVSEFIEHGDVRWIDPDTGATGTVRSDVRYPNGLALSADGQSLVFVAERPSLKPVVLKSDRVGPAEWGPTDGIYANWTRQFDGVETDRCGNVYVMDYSRGDLVRISPDGTEVDVLITLSDDNPSEHFSSLRWGTGVGGWDQDSLYVTDRTWVYELFVGAPGRPSAAVARRR